MSIVHPRTKIRSCGLAGPVVAALLCLTAIAAVPASAQDNGAAAPSNLPEDHSPHGALWRAAAVPGWGQYYNRQYFKIPVVWIGIGGLAASAIAVNQHYLLYRHAFHFVTRREDGIPLFPEYERDFEEVLRINKIPREGAEQFAGHFRQKRDDLRRNRDLLYIGVGLFHGLAILDAYVNAHLLEFDVGEDLTLSVYPIPAGFSASLRLGR